MKKIALLPVIAAAALAAWSCTEENPEQMTGGDVISFTLAAPELTSDEETRTSLDGTAGSGSAVRYQYKWDAGDAIAISSFDKSVQGNVTSWGDFVTAAGGSSATFTGYAPSAYKGSSFMAITAGCSGGINLVWDASGSRYLADFNIPSEQDGTGGKYCMFCGLLDYDASEKVFSLSNADTDHRMLMRSSLSFLVVPEDADVRKITVNVTAAKKPGSQFLASTGTNKDIHLNCSNLGLSGGSNQTITIYNDGKKLSGPVYFASRHTTGNATNGYVTLTFNFTNGSGQVAVKQMRLASGANEDGTASTYYNLKQYSVNKLGNVSFGPGDFEGELSDEIDRIPDFSRVGYKYGDEDIPSPSVKATIDIASVSAAIAAGTASDTTDFFQKTIDKVGAAGGGAILVKNGTYNISRILFIDRNNVVLRGESRDNTVLYSTTHLGIPMVYIGKTVAWQSGDTESSSLTNVSDRRVGISRLTAMGNTGSSSFGTVTIVTYSPAVPNRTDGDAVKINEDYVPLGRLYVKVSNPGAFNVGDPVHIERLGTDEWIHSIGMDRIADNGRSSVGSPTQQWTPNSYNFRWTRVVTAKDGNKVYLDAPVPHSLESRYGGANLRRYWLTRVKGCGVENITFDCRYDASVVYNGNKVDELHAWIAVQVKAAEHCWIRNVTSRHMGYGLVDINRYARCITVDNCSCLEPISSIQGARRYAFCLSAGAELCLVKNSNCDSDRHSFVTNGSALGPNVFTNCSSTNGSNAIGPHYGYATATLFDCIMADSEFAAQDGGCQGAGHGWRGVNTVFWNVNSQGKPIVCQSTWGTCPSCGHEYNRTETCSACGAEVIPAARNYAVGCVGQKKARTINWDSDYYGNATSDYFVNLYGYGTYGENRPDGSWYPERTYESTGGAYVKLPMTAPVSWWPALTQSSYSSPYSLYQCQLEDRHARGIYLNNL